MTRRQALEILGAAAAGVVAGSSSFAQTPRFSKAASWTEVLHTIMVDNPRRFLAFVPKRPRKR